MRIKLKDIKPNPANPRLIRDNQFKALKLSIAQFPAMLEKRGIAVIKEGGKYIAIGGNQRYRALTDLCVEVLDQSTFVSMYGTTDASHAVLVEYFANGVPCVDCSDLTTEEQRRFIIADNVPFGEWDTDALANEWDTNELKDWGVYIHVWGNEKDYDELDDSVPSADGSHKTNEHTCPKCNFTWLKR